VVGWFRSAVTAGGRTTSQHHGRRPRRDRRLLAGIRGEPGAWRRARRVRRAGWGNAPFLCTVARPSPTRLIRTDHEVVRAQRLSVPDPGIEVQDAGGRGPEVGVPDRDPRPVLPRLEGILGQPAPHRGHRGRDLATGGHSRASSGQLHFDSGTPDSAGSAHPNATTSAGRWGSLPRPCGTTSWARLRWGWSRATPSTRRSSPLDRARRWSSRTRRNRSALEWASRPTPVPAGASECR
jgi:hypothetical protein